LVLLLLLLPLVAVVVTATGTLMGTIRGDVALVGMTESGVFVLGVVAVIVDDAVTAEDADGDSFAVDVVLQQGGLF
jgi:hypothetical protein